MTASRRVLWVSALVPWVVAALVWGVVRLASDPPDGAEPVTRAVPADDRGPARAVQMSARASDWPTILDRLDRRRERAYAADDPARLRAVYVPRSPVLRHDLAMLRAYRGRGVSLTGVRLRALDVRLVDRAGPYVRLRVVDRLRRVTAHTSTGSVRLPRDRATARVVVLRAGADGWRIAAVRPVAG